VKAPEQQQSLTGVLRVARQDQVQRAARRSCHRLADPDPRRRSARSTAVQADEQFRGRAARTAWGGADAGRVSGRYTDVEWRESQHLERLGARHRFLLIIALGVLAPLTMALAVRSDPSWRPTAPVSLATAALFVVFLLLPWGNASFLIAIVTLFAWPGAVAVCLATA
jgi:hypothetical protein